MDTRESTRLDEATEWEKAVDCDLKLDPDADENSRIVFGDTFAPAADAERARAVLKALGCNNIRIHKRAAWLIRQIAPQLEGLAANVRAQAVINATVLCWVLLEPTDRLPIDVVIVPDAERLWAELDELEEDEAADEKNQRKQDEKRWRLLAQKTDYSPIEAAPYFVSLISSGWCDGAALAAALAKLDIEVDSQRARDRVHELIFRAYVGDFNIARGPYIEQARTILREEVNSLTVFDFSSSLVQVRMCGGDAADLAQLFIERRSAHLDLVAQSHDRQAIADPILDADVKRRERAFLSTRFTLDGVANDIVARDGWHQDEIRYLADCNVEEYERWLLTAGPVNLRQKVKRLLDLRKMG